MKPQFECSCDRCKAACTHRPGWFLPGEAEEAAAGLGISFQGFFETSLAVDVVGTIEHGDVLVLMPVMGEAPAGEKLPPDTFGVCTFFQDGRCEIHEKGKPAECALATHWGGAAPATIVAAWLPHQEKIRDLLKERTQ